MPAKKKPFRKILPIPYPPVSFTVEDARRAVREVLEEDRRASEAEAASRNPTSKSRKGRSAPPDARSVA